MGSALTGIPANIIDSFYVDWQVAVETSIAEAKGIAEIHFVFLEGDEVFDAWQQAAAAAKLQPIATPNALGTEKTVGGSTISLPCTVPLCPEGNVVREYLVSGSEVKITQQESPKSWDLFQNFK